MKIPRRDNNIKNASTSEMMIKQCAFCYKMLLILSYYLLATITLITVRFFVVYTDICFLFPSIL